MTTTSLSAAPDAAGLIGAWELESAKDLKSGQVWGTIFYLQMFVILAACRACGWAVRRFLRQPQVMAK